MNDSRTPGPARGMRTARRLVLLASTAGLGIAVLLGGPGNVPNLSALSTAALAQNAQRPTGFADIVEKVKPAVISVRVKLDEGPQTSSEEGLPFPPGSPFDRFFRQFGAPNTPNMPNMPNGRHQVTGQGSGFFISADGYAVTNNHVVDKAKTVEVTTDDGKSYTAKVIGTDPKTDLALIKIDGRGDFSYVKFADATPRVGDWVLAVGNPFGLGGTVTAGIVSARGRDIGAGGTDDFLQIDAAVNRGNSGGPTFNLAGEVIGVNTAIVSPSGGSVGIAFAIPSETVTRVVASLKETGSVTRGYLGVNVKLTVIRDGKERTIEVSLAKLPDQRADRPAERGGGKSQGTDLSGLGLSLAPAPSMGAGREGVVVTEVDPSGPAAERGLKSGDVILEAGGKPVSNATD